MKELVFVNERGRKVVITKYEPRGSYSEYIVNMDYYNHKAFKTLNGAKRYLERNGYVEA